MNWLEVGTVALLAAAPVSELRGALPLPHFVFGWPILNPFIFCVIVNALAGAADG